MSQKDSSSKIKAQSGSGGGSSSSRKSGNTRYRMQAAMAQEEAAKAAAEQQAKLQAQRSKEQPQPQAIEQAQPEAPKSRPEGEGEISEDNVRGLWKSRVLASYKGKSPKDSHTLLAKVPDGKAVVQVSDHFKTTNIQEAMIVTVDRMFDILQNCAYEFNKIAHGTELELNWIRPFLSKESTTTWHQNEGIVLVFSGRMSTRRWTLVVKGTQEEIVTYILPTDKLIGFALSHKNFKPYLTLVPHAQELDVCWKVRNQIISNENLQFVFKGVFDALIRFAREEASLDEQFDLRSVGIEPDAEAKDEDAERHRFYQEQFFQDMRSRQDKQQDFAPAAPGDTAEHQPSSFSGALPGASEDDFPPRSAQRVPPPPPQPGTWKTSLPNQAHLNMPAMPPAGSQPLQPPQPPPPHPAHMPPMPGLNPPMPPVNQPNAGNFPPYPLDPNARLPHAGQVPPAPPWPPAPPQMPPLPQMPPPPPPLPPAPGYGQYPQTAAQQMTSQQHLHQIQSHQQQGPSDLQPVMPSPSQHPHSSHTSAAAPSHMQQTYGQPEATPAFNEQNLGDVLQALVTCLDRELEVVAKAGADAFAQRDLNRADAALKFSERLTDFRSVAQELLSYYKDR